MHTLSVLVLATAVSANLEREICGSAHSSKTGSAPSQSSGVNKDSYVNHTPHDATSEFCVSFAFDYVIELADHFAVQGIGSRRLG